MFKHFLSENELCKISKPSETMTYSIFATRIFIFCQSTEKELVIEKEIEMDEQREKLRKYR